MIIMTKTLLVIGASQLVRALSHPTPISWVGLPGSRHVLHRDSTDSCDGWSPVCWLTLAMDWDA